MAKIISGIIKVELCTAEAEAIKKLIGTSSHISRIENGLSSRQSEILEQLYDQLLSMPFIERNKNVRKD